ncbi:MAG: alpha/beta fold hydrolase [Pseudomonadota bacterium]
MGAVGDETDALTCGEQAVRLDDGSIWPQVPLRISDTPFTAGDVTLAGQLIEPPDADASTPLIVIAHGSEPSGWIEIARDPYQMVGRGISVFVYDKRGTGHSEGAYTQNFPQLADDLIAASAEARRMAEGRYGRFGLFGLSQGGWIAPLAAERAGAEFIGIGYGLVVDIREEDAAQVELELREAGYGDDVIAKARTLTDATALIVTSGYREGLEELDAARDLYRDEPWYALVRGGFTGVMLGLSSEEMRTNGIPQFDRLNIDWSLVPMEVLRGVAVPQLWVLAAMDREAPVDVTLERLQTLKSEGKDITIFMFPETDHGMWEYVQAEDGSRRTTKITAGYYDLMADWAKGGAQKSYGAASAQ